jgi:hypothetical protein
VLDRNVQIRRDLTAVRDALDQPALHPHRLQIQKPQADVGWQGGFEGVDQRQQVRPAAQISAIRGQVLADQAYLADTLTDQRLRLPDQRRDGKTARAAPDTRDRAVRTTVGTALRNLETADVRGRAG